MKISRNWMLLAILIYGAFLRFYGIQWGLPYEYQSEEYKIVKYALKMGSGDLNPHFFEYPSLYLYFMLFVYGLYYIAGRGVGLFANSHDFALSFVKDITPFYLMGRISEALCGIFIIYLVYRIGRKLFSENVGLCSALIFSALPHFINLSHIIKGYMGMIVLLLLFFEMALRIAEVGDRKSYLLSALFLGLAISTRYHAAPFGILLPLAHFLIYRKENSKIFVLSLFLVPLFFLLGTPYSVLSPHEFWQDLGGNIAIYGKLSGAEGSYAHSLFLAASHFLILGDSPAPLLLGIVTLIGFINSLIHWERKHLFALVPILTYLLVVGKYHHPAAGYLLQVFPLFVIWGVHGLLTLFENPPLQFLNRGVLRFTPFAVLLVAMAWNLLEGTKLAYSFTVKDTRTIAKEWIEENIPQGSRILIDNKTQTPPLQMSYRQLKKFHDRAVELNHYKKEYLGLQLEVHPGKNIGYDIYIIDRSFRQIGSLEHQVDEVRKLQDLVVADQDIKKLKKSGIEYVVTNDYSSEGSLRNNDILAGFYRALPAGAQLLKVIPPGYAIIQGSTIRIYKL